MTTFPNLYVTLIGPPGTGKSVVVEPIAKLLRSTPPLIVAPSSMTTASLIDTLKLAERSAIPPGGGILPFNSLQVIASELGVFLTSYDAAFMNTLTKLYDGETYEERRRTKDLHVLIESPILSILAGGTPGYLHSFLPDVAWDQGFMSRVILVFSAAQINSFSWEAPASNEELYKTLMADLRKIASISGEMRWTPEARDVMINWIHAGMKPTPFHSKLVHYNARRQLHMFKLCMVASMARTNSRVIELEDYQCAQEWLLEAEGEMPEIFKTMGLSQDARIQEDAWHYIHAYYMKNSKKPVPEGVLHDFLRNRVASHQVVPNIETMVRSGMIKYDNLHGMTAFVPIQVERRNV